MTAVHAKVDVLEIFFPLALFLREDIAEAVLPIGRDRVEDWLQRGLTDDWRLSRCPKQGRGRCGDFT